MIPGGHLSTRPIAGRIIHPASGDPAVSHHFGPVALNDPSQGLFVQMWTGRAVENEIRLSAPNHPESVLLSRGANVTEASIAFDQNGQPYAAFVESSGDAFLYWYDTQEEQLKVTPIAGAVNPRITLDDARAPMNDINDIILAYVRDGLLRYRQQRDRFGVEHTLTEGEAGPQVAADGLLHVSMSDKLRLEFMVEEAA